MDGQTACTLTFSLPTGVVILDGNPNVKYGNRSKEPTEELPKLLIFTVYGRHGLQLGNREALSKLDRGSQCALKKDGKVTICIDIKGYKEFKRQKYARTEKRGVKHPITYAKLAQCVTDVVQRFISEAVEPYTSLPWPGEQLKLANLYIIALVRYSQATYKCVLGYSSSGTSKHHDSRWSPTLGPLLQAGHFSPDFAAGPSHTSPATFRASGQPTRTTLCQGPEYHILSQSSVWVPATSPDYSRISYKPTSRFASSISQDEIGRVLPTAHDDHHIPSFAQHYSKTERQAGHNSSATFAETRQNSWDSVPDTDTDPFHAAYRLPGPYYPVHNTVAGKVDVAARHSYAARPSEPLSAECDEEAYFDGVSQDAQYTLVAAVSPEVYLPQAVGLDFYDQPVAGCGTSEAGRWPSHKAPCL